MGLLYVFLTVTKTHCKGGCFKVADGNQYLEMQYVFCMTLSKTPGWIQNIIVLRRRTVEYEYFIELMYFIACPSNYSRIAIGRVLYRLNAAEANLHNTLLLFPSELRVSDLKRHRNGNTNFGPFYVCIYTSPRFNSRRE